MLSWLRTSCLWVFGLEDNSVAKEEPKGGSLISSLEQDPRARIFLNINLVVIVAICIGLFAYFSVNPFPNGFDPEAYTAKPME